MAVAMECNTGHGHDIRLARVGVRGFDSRPSPLGPQRAVQGRNEQVTAHKMVWLACDVDECPDTTAEYTEAETVSQAREHARQLGWTRVRGRDLCNEHSNT